ncbi:MAG TPA: metallophosphoesterase [Candidatus Eisenbacteria bacterium]|nr:metallophosphoesterase [Candidatus Eisenbacteria bacterium]
MSAVQARRAAATIALLGVAAPLAAGSCFAAALTRYPSVWHRTKDSVTIAWQTDVPSSGTVLFGPTPGLGASRSHGGTVVDHAVLVDGLDPGSTYYYRVVSDADTLGSSEQVATAPDGDAPFRFLAFGDLGAATPEQVEIASRIDSLNADLAILTGDIIYEAGEAENFTPQYFDVYRPTIARIPFYPSLGNHDVVTSNGLPYLDAFYLPVNSSTGTERYYSFDYANAHFAALEITVESVPPDPTMLAWLDQDLAATSQLWKFVYFHVPALSNAGVHGGDPVVQAALDPILEARGVDVVFQGHNHFYTRTYPTIGTTPVAAAQEPDYLNPGAPIYIVTGGGGRFLHAIGPLAPFEAFSKSTFHVTSVDVDGNTLTLRAIERDGHVMDSMTLTKESTTAVALLDYAAESEADGVRLRWRVSRPTDVSGFHVYRGPGPETVEERLTAEPLLSEAEAFDYLDRTAVVGASYYYALGAIDLRGREERVGLVRGTRGAPYRFEIRGAVPNPFARGSEIRFTLDRASRVGVSIHDASGREVRRLAPGRLGSGPHALAWDGRDGRGRIAAAGVYFVRIRSEERTAVAKLVRVP